MLRPIRYQFLALYWPEKLPVHAFEWSYFQSENRGNDSIISGNKQIREFYEKKQNKNTTVNWTPDFIEVSKDGTLAYTYGKYVWKIRKEDGTTSESKGVFHTVWKLQQDKTWKYVWD